MAIDCFKEVCCDLNFDQLISELLVETQVREVSATLSVMLEVLGIFKHINHELDSLISCDSRVAVKHFCDVSKRGGSIKGCLWISCRTTKLNNGLNNLIFSSVRFWFLTVLNLESLDLTLMQVIVLKDVLKSFGYFSEN